MSLLLQEMEQMMLRPCQKLTLDSLWVKLELMLQEMLLILLF